MSDLKDETLNHIQALAEDGVTFAEDTLALVAALQNAVAALARHRAFADEVWAITSGERGNVTYADAVVLTRTAHRKHLAAS